MLTFRTAAVLTSCAAGIGYFVGRNHPQLSFNSTEDDKDIGYVIPRIRKGAKEPEELAVHGLDDIFNFLPTMSVKAKSQFPVTMPPAQQASGQSQIGEIMKYGFPTTEVLRTYNDFMLSYDPRNRTANWVLEHLTPEKVNKAEGVERSKMKFVEDQSIHEFHRSTNKDYQGSGYDRGHLAAAANHRQSELAMNQTFILSNIAPQVGDGFNRDAWNNLEKYVRAIARKSKNVYVCTGPLYLPRKEPDGKLYVKYEVIGPNHVAVPTHFFKVVVVENDFGQFDLLSYIMPNQPLPNVKLHNYLMPLETIERAAGLNFFQKIPKSSFKRINPKTGS